MSLSLFVIVSLMSLSSLSLLSLLSLSLSSLSPLSLSPSPSLSILSLFSLSSHSLLSLLSLSSLSRLSLLSSLDGAPRQSLQARLNRKAADSPASKPTATQQSTGTGDRPAPSKQPSYRCRCEVHQHRGSPGSLEAAHQEQSGCRCEVHQRIRVHHRFTSIRDSQ